MSHNLSGLIRVHRTQQLPTSPRVRGRMCPTGQEPCHGGYQPPWGMQAVCGRLLEPNPGTGKSPALPCFPCPPPSFIHMGLLRRDGEEPSWAGSRVAVSFSLCNAPEDRPVHLHAHPSSPTHAHTGKRARCGARVPFAQALSRARCQLVPKHACKACVYALISSETAPLLPMPGPRASQASHPPPKPLFLTLLPLPPPGLQLPGATRSLL